MTKLLASLGAAAMTVALAGQAYALNPQTLPPRASGVQKGTHVVVRHPRHASIVTGVSHSIIAPRDVHTGLATGRRRHSPLVIRRAGGGKGY